MRIALITDIHGNLVSLEAVLAEIERERPDALVCLGDVATIGPQPREVIDRLRGLDCRFVRGNHEDYLLRVAASESPGDVSPLLRETVEWCAAEISTEQMEFLRGFEPSLLVELSAGVDLLCFHGSPGSNTDIILATTPVAQLDAFLAGTAAPILAGGHTHIQMMRRHRDRLVINPGSAGEPLAELPARGTFPRILPWAEYAIISAGGGRVDVDLRRIPFDMERFRAASAASANPFSWLPQWADGG